LSFIATKPTSLSKREIKVQARSLAVSSERSHGLVGYAEDHFASGRFFFGRSEFAMREHQKASIAGLVKVGQLSMAGPSGVPRPEIRIIRGDDSLCLEVFYRFAIDRKAN